MSRLDDLIDLIQTTNEVYFITAPGRVRTAYILVDDIIELALKTYLQEQVFQRRQVCTTTLETVGLVSTDAHRARARDFYNENIDFTTLCQRLGIAAGSPPETTLETTINTHDRAFLQHWTINHPETFKVFEDVVTEVKGLQPAGDPIIDVLTEVNNRHDERNRFYHDHTRTGWAVSDENCLRAMGDLYTLMESLFPNFQTKISREYLTVRCQIGVLKLKMASMRGRGELNEPYDNALQELKKGHRFDFQQRSLEHSLIHTVSDRFFIALRNQFEAATSKLQLRIDEIDAMPDAHRRKKQQERDDKDNLLGILRQQLDEIRTLMGTP